MKASKRARGRNSGVWSSCGDDVVVLVGVFRAEAPGEAELVFEGVVEPEAGGGSAEEVVVPGEDAPDLAGVGAFFAVDLGDAEGFEGDSLRVEHAEDVVVGLDEELGGIGKWLVEREPGGVGVAVRRDDGQVAYGFVESCGDGACLSVRGKQPVVIQNLHSCLTFRSRLVWRKASIGSVSKISPHPEQKQDTK